MVLFTKASKSSGKGFTIIELLVSIVVVIILTTIVFANYRSGERRYALQRAGNKLAQDIRRTQEMATSTKKWNGSIPLGGFGVYFPQISGNITYYIIFADVNGNRQYDGSSERVDQVTIEKGVKISSYNPAAVPATNPAWVIFVPPDPTVLFDTAQGRPLASQSRTITLTSISDNTITDDVVVNIAGMIELQ